MNVAIGAQSPDIAGGVFNSHENRSGISEDEIDARARATRA